MSLTRQIEAARVAREREGKRIDAQMKALKEADDALMSEGRLDAEIATMLEAREILPTLTEAQQQHIRAKEYDSSLVRKGVCNPRYADAVVWGMGNALTPLGRTLRAMLTGMSPTPPVLRRLAQHAIDAHCAARAAGERSVYDRADLEKYIEADRLDPMSEIRILTRRLLPSEALTVLLSLLPPENE